MTWSLFDNECNVFEYIGEFECIVIILTKITIYLAIYNVTCYIVTLGLTKSSVQIYSS